MLAFSLPGLAGLLVGLALIATWRACLYAGHRWADELNEALGVIAAVGILWLLVAGFIIGFLR